MTSLLETDHGTSTTEVVRRQRLSRRTRWVVGIAAGALFASALGYLIADQEQAHDRYGQARTALGVTRQRTHTISAQLAQVRRDLSLLETQVGSDTTALNQDAAQLLGAQTSLAAAQSHVTQQASLISSLQTCLAGVEQALNALAVGKQANAIAALNAVSTSCTAAEAASG
jgi:chromosome segregation ATPase